MNIIKRIASVSLAALVILLAIIVGTSADETDIGPNGPKFNPENHQAIMEAVEQCDYDAWHALLTENDREPKILEYINEENFDRFCEMHQHLAEAKAIAEELGLPKPGNMMKGKFPKGQRPELTDEQKAVMQEARELFQAGDKEGAKELLEEAGIQFGKFRRLRGRHNWQGPID